MNRFERLRLHISEKEGRVLSSRELSVLLGLSTALYNKIEREELSPSPKVAERLSVKYGISKAWFLREEGEAPWDLAATRAHWDRVAEMQRRIEEGELEPGAEKPYAGFLALCELIGGPHEKLVDYFIEAGRDPRVREYIYNVLEGSPKKMLDSLAQSRDQIRKLRQELDAERRARAGQAEKIQSLEAGSTTVSRKPVRKAADKGGEK